MSHEVRVLFDTLGDGRFAVRLDAGNGPVAAGTFAPFLDDKNDYEDLRWYLEDFMDLPDGGAITRARAVEGRIAGWGRALYAALFADAACRALLDELLARPEPRLLTLATGELDLLRLPWEMMADDAGRLADRVSIRRQPDAPGPGASKPLPRPLRLLYVISRPSDAGFLDPRLTTKALFDALDPLGASVSIDFCRPPTRSRLEEMLRAADGKGEPYHVLHFDGHGTFLPQAQIGALCFEKGDGTDEGKTDLIDADDLGNLLARHHLPLVVLEACRSATVGKMSVFRSVAPRLMRAGVGSVVSMGHAVHVEAARVLLERFYRELACGKTVGEAVASGRSALANRPARWVQPGPLGKTIDLADWFLPHLYQRGGDEALFPADGSANRPVREFDVFLSNNHNEQDRPRVEAVATRLTERHGLRVWLDVWECRSGDLKRQCEAGIRNSRFTVVAVSPKALASKWVEWEIAKHNELNPDGDHLLPIKVQPTDMPPDLDAKLWVDFTDPANDAERAADLAGLIRARDAEDSRARRGYVPHHTDRSEPGCFPRPPMYSFLGRARELHDLERRLRRQRGVVLHAMGGMGKTSLATEAAAWWTRSGLFRDGACFISFETFANAERVVQVLGQYVEGHHFHKLPPAAQRRRAVEIFKTRDVLMVWDNFESTLAQFNDGNADIGSPYDDDERRRLCELFRDLTEGDGRGRLLVTCRPGETGLRGAARMELGGLAREDSLWLLQRILEKDGTGLKKSGFTRERLDPLLGDLADHPLSLELVGPHLVRLGPERIRAEFGELMARFTQDADEGRNRSLMASLEFSRRHLSEKAREAMRWLGLFRGGVFEAILLDVSGIDAEAWEPIREELRGIALVRVEEDITVGDRPYLRFHPTLAAASTNLDLARDDGTRARYVEGYLELQRMLHAALIGSQSRMAMGILGCDCANYRGAVLWAVEARRYPEAARLGDTFREYLQRSGRLRERDSWVKWLRGAVAREEFTAEVADVEQEYAWTLFTNGDPQCAADRLNALADRLTATTAFDPASQLAGTLMVLGRVLYQSGAAADAVPVLRDAITRWESLAERKGGKPWRELLGSPDRAKTSVELGNLSAAMGDLANAAGHIGRHDEALSVAEEGVRIDEALGRQRNAAAGHIQCAWILALAGRYDKADARYTIALDAARLAGDKMLEGTTLQHQGTVADDRNDLVRAARLYRLALGAFQDADDASGVMQIYNSLGIVEQKAGRIAAAREWLTKSREMAVALKNKRSIATAAQNIGIVCQSEGEAARASGDEQAASQHFEAALASVSESLEMKQAQGNKPGEAKSLCQLAQIHLLRGDIDAAEHDAHAALAIREDLGLLEARFDYHTLAAIAQARGEESAAEWSRKRDDLLAEADRRARGTGNA